MCMGWVIVGLGVCMYVWVVVVALNFLDIYFSLIVGPGDLDREK